MYSKKEKVQMSDTSHGKYSDSVTRYFLIEKSQTINFATSRIRMVGLPRKHVELLLFMYV